MTTQQLKRLINQRLRQSVHAGNIKLQKILYWLMNQGAFTKHYYNQGQPVTDPDEVHKMIIQRIESLIINIPAKNNLDDYITGFNIK